MSLGRAFEKALNIRSLNNHTYETGFIGILYPSMPYRNEAGYLQLLSDVIETGQTRPDRTGTGTRSLFAPDPLRFDISTSVPLYTTKKVPWKMVIKELLWFLRGHTDATLLQEQGVHIWDGHTSEDFLRQRGLPYRAGILGPGYGWQWRRFGAPYDETFARANPVEDVETSEAPVGFDQISHIEHLLKTDKSSRRIYLNAWNAKDLDQMALVPCHVACQFYVDNDNGLSAHVYIRSNDLFLGNPFNVFSYSILTYLLAARCSLKPKELIISFGDAHVYLDHLPQVKEQVQRSLHAPPRLILNDRVANLDYKDMTIDDFSVEEYVHHPALKGTMSI